MNIKTQILATSDHNRFRTTDYGTSGQADYGGALQVPVLEHPRTALDEPVMHPTCLRGYRCVSNRLYYILKPTRSKNCIRFIGEREDK